MSEEDNDESFSKQSKLLSEEDNDESFSKQSKVLSEEDNESVFSKRSKLMPKKSAEELKAAEDLVKKLEEEKEAEKAATSSKKGKKNKAAPQTEDDIDCLEVDVDSVPLSAAAKKRLKKIRDEGKRELENIEAENAKILSADVSDLPKAQEEPGTPEEEKTLYLTISYFNKYKRFKHLKDEKFLKVFKDVADFFELNPAEIILCLKERNIAMSDTPNSLGLSECDIIECLPYKVGESANSLLDSNCVEITFQSNDTKTKVDMIVNKMEKMSTLMERYSKKRNLPLNELTFEFDGEKLSGTETPGELDMESGSCIDVRVFVPVAECSYTKDEPEDKDMEKFIIIDSDTNDSDVVVLD